jgi:hypothetical protein
MMTLVESETMCLRRPVSNRRGVDRQKDVDLTWTQPKTRRVRSLDDVDGPHVLKECTILEGVVGVTIVDVEMVMQDGDA